MANRVVKNKPHKRRRRRRRQRRGQPWYRRKYSAMELAGKAWEATKYIKSLINVEQKHHDVVFEDLSAQLAEITPLTNVVQGITDETRVGDSMKATSLHIRGRFRNTTSSIKRVRVLICRDMSDMNGGGPAVTDILDSPSTNIYAYRNIDSASAGKYKVLSDHGQTLGVAGSGYEYFDFKYNFELDDHITFTGAGASDYKSGHYFVLYMTDTNTLNDVQFTFGSRLRYVDN